MVLEVYCDIFHVYVCCITLLINFGMTRYSTLRHECAYVLFSTIDIISYIQIRLEYIPSTIIVREIFHSLNLNDKFDIGKQLFIIIDYLL